MQEGWAASVCPKADQQRLPLKRRVPRRFDRTAKHREKPARRTEDGFRSEVGPGRMLNWPASVSQARVKWEMSAHKFKGQQCVMRR